MRRIAILATALLSGWTAVGSERENEEAHARSPREILVKHYEKTGQLTHKLPSTASIYYGKAILVSNGDSLFATFRRYSITPVLFRETTVSGEHRADGGYNGRCLWSFNDGEFSIMNDSASLANRQIDSMMACFEQLEPETPYFELEHAGTENLSGIECFRIVMRNALTDAVATYFIDTLTYYKLKERSESPHFTSEIVFSDFRTIDGIVFSFVWEGISLPDSIRLNRLTDSILLDVTIDDTIFDPPKEYGESDKCTEETED
jgi:hypothetical protein